MSTGSRSKNRTNPFFYGWVVVFVSAILVFFSGPGQTYGVSEFVGSFVKQFHGNETLVSGIYSTATLLSGSLLFLMGRCVDTYGQRIMGVIAAVMLGVACLWSSFVANPLMLFIAFFMLRYFGQGSMTLIPNTLVPQWFIKKRGRAMSFMAIGSFVSAVTFPLLNTWLIKRFGAMHAWQILALLIVLIVVPIVAVFTKNTPYEIGLHPDNSTHDGSSGDNASESAALEVEESWTLKEARRTRAFWFMLFCVSLPALVNTAITFHLFEIFKQNHMSMAMASLTLSLMGFIGFPVTLIAGSVLDRVPVHKVIGISFIGQLVFIGLLIVMRNNLEVVLFGILWGIMSGFERITLNIIWPNYFGRKYLGSISGIAQAVMVIGSALGPLPLGFAYERFGNFSTGLFMLMIFPILGIFAAFTSPRPMREQARVGRTN